MGFKHPTNNRILNNNARAADVATKAIQEIIPVQQAKYYAAFRPQGVTSVVYNRMTSGRKCTCQSKRKTLNTKLGIDGKASPGAINELITGQVFDVTAYGGRKNRSNDELYDVHTSPNAPVNKYQGDADRRSDGDMVYEDTNFTDGFGDNGPTDGVSLDFTDFDMEHVGFSDASCCVCFGTGYIGGYQPFHGFRYVAAVPDLDSNGRIDTLKVPFSIVASELQFKVTLPRGTIGLDSLRVFNNYTPVTANFIIDNTAITNTGTFMRFCDGLPHTITVKLQEVAEITHVEIQLVLSNESVFLEFPRLTKGSDLSKLNSLESFQIVVSPNVPELKEEDIIVESMFGFHLMVQSSAWWNSRQRNVLGWECPVRVVQPQEHYTILPNRGRVKSKNETTNMVHDNVTGDRRT